MAVGCDFVVATDGGGVRISSGYMMVTTYIAPWSWSLLMGEIPSNYGNLIDGICWMVRVYWVL